MMEVGLFLAVASWIIDNVPRVQDLIARHQSGDPLTQEQVNQLVAEARRQSDQVNEDWKNA